MMQRFGAVFAIAPASAVFAADGHLGTPAGVTDGFKPALAACAGFALLSPRVPAQLADMGFTVMHVADVGLLTAADEAILELRQRQPIGDRLR
jgi:hypothetical protein